MQSRANPRPQSYIQDDEDDERRADAAAVDAACPAGSAASRRSRITPQDYVEEEPEEYQPAPVHPLHRYAAQQPAAPAQHYQQDYQEEQQYADEPQYADEAQPADPSRYDDALYGQLESGQQEYQRDPAYPDDPYAYQSDYEEEPEPKRRSSGLVTVAAVLALAVVGTGAAFAYRTYVGSPRSGEPPIIKADNSPTKIVPAPADGASGKTPDRMLPGDGGEKLVSREETPVDVNSRSGAPRVVFPPLNQNGSPPPVASVSPAAPPPPAAANGTMPNNEPRKIKTLAVKGDARQRRRSGERGSARGQTGAPRRAAIASLRATRSPPPPAPMRRCRCHRRPGRTGPGSPRPGWPPPIRRSQRRRPAVATWFRSPRRRTRPTPHASYRALQGKFSAAAGLPLAGDQAGGSRRQGRLLPRHGRAVRLAGRGLPVLRQSENRRRTVRRPKELTAVSLTRER